MSIQIGIGNIFVVPVGGNLATNPTPTFIPVAQDINVDMAGTVKELMGQYKFPVDVAPVDMKVSGKFSCGSPNILFENNMLYADVVAPGVISLPQLSGGETHTIAASVATTHSANFSVDLGVIWNGIPMTKVASSPASGQYSVSSGTYSFNSTDVTTGGTVGIFYGYTASSTGSTLTINNQLIGYGPVVGLYISEAYQPGAGNTVNGIYLPQVRVLGSKAPYKRADYKITEYDFSAFANQAGVVAVKYQATVV